MKKRHSLKGLFDWPETAQLKGGFAWGIRVGARKLQTVGEVEEENHLCLSLGIQAKPVSCAVLKSSLGPDKRRTNVRLVIPVMISRCTGYSLLCRVDGTWEPLEVLVWPSESSCECPWLCLHDHTGNVVSLSPREFLRETEKYKI